MPTLLKNLQSRIWNKYSIPDCKFTILSLSNFMKRELKLMLFWKSLWKIQLPFSKITKGKGKYIYNPEINIYSRSGIVKFHFFNGVLISGVSKFHLGGQKFNSRFKQYNLYNL